MNELWKEKQNMIVENAKKIYDWAIENGIAKEQTRSVLPEGMTMSKMYVNGNLRFSNGTQKEHIEVALACAKEIEVIFPMINDLVFNSF